MRVNNYVQKFEDETKGYRIANNKLTIIRVVITFTIFAFLISLVITMTKRDNINSAFIENENLNTFLQSKSNKKINFPTSAPTFMPINNFEMFNDDYDDDNIDTLKIKKSKYPTHHPKKDKTTTAYPSQNIISSVIPIILSETTTEAPTPLVTLISSEITTLSPAPNVQPTTIIVTDDFHVTPIVVINTDHKNDGTHTSH
jgi:hypothetical protein